MKNPSLADSNKDKWDNDKGNALDSLRLPVRSMQAGNAEAIFQDLRLRIHRRLIDTLDLTKLSNLEMERVRVEIRRILEDMVAAEAIPVSRADRDRLVMEVQHEVFGLGPLNFNEGPRDFRHTRKLFQPDFCRTLRQTGEKRRQIS